jgi:hypothetical protein
MNSRILDRIRVVLLGAWLGIAIYFSAVVAPAAFGALRAFALANAGEVAGTIVTRTLSTVNISGFVLSVLLLLTALGVRTCYGRTSFILQNVLLAAIAISTATGQWLIAPRMVSLRAAMRGQIDQIPLTDPARVAFATLHGYSVLALAIAMIAALFTLVLNVFARSGNSGKS